MTLLYARPDDALNFVVRLLRAHGVPEADGLVVAQCLVRADLRGVASHGVGHLPIYLERLRLDLINRQPNLVVLRTTPVAASIDGENGFGFVVATRAMAEAIAMAEAMGIGIVSARHSTHFGMAACYVLQALEAGMMGLVFTNASPAMPPWGGRKSIFGTSPFAAGAPGGTLGPFVLDMSPAVMARGRIRRAARQSEAIPPGAALDAEGNPTTDAAAALAGSMLPIGGPKGSALSMLMDIFGGVISGAAFAGGVGTQYDLSAPQDVGHFFLAMKPDLFIGRQAYSDRIDELVRRVHGCPTAVGFDMVRMPGEGGSRTEAERRRTGIPYGFADLEKLVAEAGRAGVEPMDVRSDRLG
jgi:LDH2 family malate/lactate/ureidoglycolate dehydrogenase